MRLFGAGYAITPSSAVSRKMQYTWGLGYWFQCAWPQVLNHRLALSFRPDKQVQLLSCNKKLHSFLVQSLIDINRRQAC